MPKMIQIRNVPDELHAELRRRAARRKQTLTGYIQEILEQEAARGSPEEVFERIRSREPVDLESSVVEALHQAREENDRKLMRRQGP